MGIVAYLRPIPADKLPALRRDPEAVREWIGEDDAECIDKSWHAIHWLLTGVPGQAEPPLGLAVFGGENFGPKLNYGPARLVTPEQVVEVAAALAQLSDDGLRTEFDPQAMDADGIYPGSWTQEPNLAYVLSNFGTLVAVYAEAAQRGDAVLQWED